MSRANLLSRMALAALMSAFAPLPSNAQYGQGAREPTESRSSPPGGMGPGGRPKPQTAQAGAGTDNATTTGFSGPSKGGSSGQPPLPDASLCDPYQGAVRQSCLSTVLRSAPNANRG
jgi:hypothetical protein